MEAGLYLHIPFCKSKCAYCDFASFAGQEIHMAAYTKAVLREIRQKAEQYPFTIRTLFIGGGTPSVFPAAEMDILLSALHRHFSFTAGAECTCECNPGTVTEDFLSVLKKHGVHRLSFGAQASQPHLLHMLGRIHTWEDVCASVHLARMMGFHNINLDLMLGLPGQTADDVQQTLQQALSLQPTHLSCYGLIVEEGTRMHAQVQKGLWQLPDEETERAEYAMCQDVLAAHGFEQYEISNFAKPGFRCRHNWDCWHRVPYIGIGSAACGFAGNVRYQNPPALSDYLNGMPATEEIISPEDARFESMMLGLRTMEGVRENEFLQMHGISLRDAYGQKLQGPLRQGLIRWEEGRVFLTREGMNLQNRILLEIM